MRVSEMSACIWKSCPDSPIMPGYWRNEGSAPLRNLIAYLDSVKSRDPAPRSRWEILLYPGVLALGLHRVAHRLFRARSEEHTSELQSLMRISYAVFCLKKKKKILNTIKTILLHN